MTKKKPLKEEQGVSMLVLENWPHHGHSREVPLSHDIKHEVSVLGQVAAGNREMEPCQPGKAKIIPWSVVCGLAAGGIAGELVPGQAVQGGLKDTLVGLHGLGGEGHCDKVM